MNPSESIQWRPWGEAAFREARELNRPIFLSISAVWCHWCHVMDEESFEHPEVVRRLNRDFVPVRVDSDRRPDINARYNMGGWPTVALLDFEGRVVAGETYLPTGTFLQFLSQIKREETPGPRANPTEIQPPPKTAAPLDEEMIRTVAGYLERAFDPEFGGFGGPPKFPQPAAIELAFHLHHRTGDPKWLERAKLTLDAMRDGEIHDRVDGGFFRYATRGDWDKPHYEKLLDANSRLLSLYLQAFRLTGDASYRFTAHGILDYLFTTLAVEGEAWFCGSQTADAEYYRLPEEDRIGIAPPPMDRTLYTDHNASTASGLLQAGILLDDPAYLDSGIRLLTTLLARCRHFEQGMYHYIDEKAWLPGHLSDQVQMMAALEDSFEATGEWRYLDHACDLAGIMARYLWDEARGGYWDLPADSGREGFLSVRIKPFAENAAAAMGLTRLTHLTGDEAHRMHAGKVLQHLAGEIRRYKHHAAPFGLALERFLIPPLQVHVVGERGEGAWSPLLRAAHRISSPWKVVLPLDREANRDRIESLGYRPSREAAAYVCIGSRCLPPMTRPEELEGLPGASGEPGSGE